MEEKLLRMMENCKAMQTDNKDLKEHLSSTTSINTAEIKGTCVYISLMMTLLFQQLL